METRLQELEERVTRLAERVDQLERRVPGLSAVPQTWPVGESRLPGASATAEMARWVTFLGRSCLALGGAFLIRALTEGRLVPGGAGVALGILFAAAWVLFAHRAAAAGATLSAGFHGVVAAVIAYPLIAESTTRMGAMSTSAAALTLVGFTALVLGVAWRNRLGWLAWVGVLSCLLTGLVLSRATPARGEFTAVLLLLAASTFFWPEGDPRWRGLRWPPAVVVDLVLIAAVLGSTSPPVVLPLSLAALSLGLVLSRTAAGRGVGGFEALQAVVGIAIGLAGALRVSREAGVGPAAVAAGVLAIAVLATVFAGWVVPRRGNRDVDFLFYAALSLALLATGVALVTRGELRGVLWSLLALLAVLTGRRSHPTSLWSLAVLLALGATASARLGTVLWEALVGREALLWQPPSTGSLAVLALTVLGYLATVPPLRPSVPSGASSRLPAAVLLLLGGAGVAALILFGLHPLAQDLGSVASARTVVAVVVAFLLALIRRRVARPELTWIASVALVLGGVELLFVELPNGRASTLLVSFVLYGAGLLLVPRLAPPGRDLPSGQPADPMVNRS